MGRTKRDEQVGVLEVVLTYRMPILQSDYTAMIEAYVNPENDEEVMEWFEGEYENHLYDDEPYVKYNGNQQG